MDADVLCVCCSPPPIRQETVEQLLSNIFDQEKNESAIVSVIQILLTLFETRRPAYVLLLSLLPSDGAQHVGLDCFRKTCRAQLALNV